MAASREAKAQLDQLQGKWQDESKAKKSYIVQDEYCMVTNADDNNKWIAGTCDAVHRLVLHQGEVCWGSEKSFALRIHQNGEAVEWISRNKGKKGFWWKRLSWPGDESDNWYGGKGAWDDGKGAWDRGRVSWDGSRGKDGWADVHDSRGGWEAEQESDAWYGGKGARDDGKCARDGARGSWDVGRGKDGWTEVHDSKGGWEAEQELPEKDSSVQYPTLAAMVEEFKRELGVGDISVYETVDAACAQLSVADRSSGLAVLKRAETCWRILHGTKPSGVASKV